MCGGTQADDSASVRHDHKAQLVVAVIACKGSETGPHHLEILFPLPFEPDNLFLVLLEQPLLDLALSAFL